MTRTLDDSIEVVKQSPFLKEGKSGRVARWQSCKVAGILVGYLQEHVARRQRLRSAFTLPLCHLIHPCTGTVTTNRVPLPTILFTFKLPRTSSKRSCRPRNPYPLPLLEGMALEAESTGMRFAEESTIFGHGFGSRIKANAIVNQFQTTLLIAKIKVDLNLIGLCMFLYIG